MYSFPNYQTNKEKPLYSSHNYRAKYKNLMKLFLNYQTNEENLLYSFLNYQTHKEKWMVSLLNYRWFYIATLYPYPQSGWMGFRFGVCDSIELCQQWVGRGGGLTGAQMAHMLHCLKFSKINFKPMRLTPYNTFYFSFLDVKCANWKKPHIMP